MPDITKCTNSQCPLANSCYRAQCNPNEHCQSYAYFEPNKQGKCEMWIGYSGEGITLHNTMAERGITITRKKK